MPVAPSERPKGECRCAQHEDTRMSQPRAESAPADVGFPGSPVLPQTFDEDKTIRLRYHRGIACWNAVMDENNYMVQKWNEFVAA